MALTTSISYISAPSMSIQNSSSLVATESNSGSKSYSSIPLISAPVVSSSYDIDSSIPTENSQSGSSVLGLSAMKIPIPIPGSDQSGIKLGSGPNFTTKTLAKYQTIVPPYASGAIVNAASAASATSAAKSGTSSDLASIENSLLEDLN